MAKNIDTIQLKRKQTATTDVWNYVPKEGEPVFVIQTNKLYIGNGSSAISQLSPIGGEITTINLSGDGVTGTLPIGKGGTGKTSFSNGLLKSTNNVIATTSSTNTVTNNSNYIPDSQAVYKVTTAKYVSSITDTTPTSNIPQVKAVTDYINKSTSSATVAQNDTHLVTGGAVYSYIDGIKTTTINASTDTRKIPTVGAVKTYVDSHGGGGSDIVITNESSDINNAKSESSTVPNVWAVKNYSVAKSSIASSVANNDNIPKNSAIISYINTRLGTTGNLKSAATLAYTNASSSIANATENSTSYLPTCYAVKKYVLAHCRSGDTRKTVSGQVNVKDSAFGTDVNIAASGLAEFSTCSHVLVESARLSDGSCVSAYIANRDQNGALKIHVFPHKVGLYTAYFYLVGF